MRASDLKVLELLDFRADEGVIAFHDQRMLPYDADVIGILRRELVETVGPKAARGLLTRFGYADGYRDAQTLKKLFHWESPEEWHKAGLVLHALEGKALAVKTRLSGLAGGGGRPRADAPGGGGGPTGPRSSSRTSSTSRRPRSRTRSRGSSRRSARSARRRPGRSARPSGGRAWRSASRDPTRRSCGAGRCVMSSSWPSGSRRRTPRAR